MLIINKRPLCLDSLGSIFSGKPNKFVSPVGGKAGDIYPSLVVDVAFEEIAVIGIDGVIAHDLFKREIVAGLGFLPEDLLYEF